MYSAGAEIRAWQEGTGESEMALHPLSRLSAVQSSVGARVIVVSNRLPLTLRKTEDGWSTERSSGGLASAMNPLLRKGGGDWIGWPGGGGEERGRRRFRDGVRGIHRE